jgi:exopolysaccharide biosynthesis protein
MQTVTSGVVATTEVVPTFTGAQRLNTLSVDLTNPNVRLGVVQAHNRLLGPGETLSSMALRSGAVAGINGDFFEIQGSGAPLGLLKINGQLWQSPDASPVLGITASGRLTIGPETFVGSVVSGNASYPLQSINRYGDARGNLLTLFTSAPGSTLHLRGADVVALLHPGGHHMLTVTALQQNVTSLPALSAQEEALVGSRNAGSWLSAHLRAGKTLSIQERITPDNNLASALGGGAVLIRDGVLAQGLRTRSPGETRVRNPLTALGITRDGRRALLVVCDGHQADPNRSQGLTRVQMAGYLLTHGAYQAMLFDGGGSAEMVARLPGQRQASVLNSPSDGHERAIANGLFLYSTERQPGPATSVVVNNDQPLTLFTGTSTPISAYALDAQANPAADLPQLTVLPAGLAALSPGTITAGAQTGQGQLLAQAGRVRTAVTLQIIDAPSLLPALLRPQ